MNHITKEIKAALAKKTGRNWSVRWKDDRVRVTAPARRLFDGRLPASEAAALLSAFGLDADSRFDYLYLTESEARAWLKSGPVAPAKGSGSDSSLKKRSAGEKNVLPAANTAIDTADFLKMRFETRKAGRVMREMVGADNIPGQISMILTGPPSGGKSTLAVILAEDGTWSRPLLVAAEEGFGQSLRDRLRRMKAKRLKVTTATDYSAVEKIAKRENADLVILDSVTALGWDTDAVKRLLRHGFSVCGILQSRKDGDFRGGQEWKHDVGLFVAVADGRWTVEKSWYGLMNSGRIDRNAKTASDSPKIRKTGGISYEYAVMDTENLHLDPDRFQYKLKTDKRGVTSDKSRRFNFDLYDPISVWKDAKDGKWYVVNGHHRLEWARGSKIESLPVRVIEAKDWKKAREIGALQNIAAGQGTALDAAKFLRDSKMDVSAMEKLGIPLSKTKLADAAALSKLCDSVFRDVVDGKIPPSWGAAVGRHNPPESAQKKIISRARKRSREGKSVSADWIDIMARTAVLSGTTTKTENTLFGAAEWTESLYEERAAVLSYVRTRLRTDRKVLSTVAKREATVESIKGNRIDAEASGKAAKSLEWLLELFEKKAWQKGAVSDVLNAAAREISDGKNRRTVFSEAYRKIVASLTEPANKSGENAVTG